MQAIQKTTETWYKWEEMEREAVTPQLERKLVWGERLMVAQVFLKKGCVVPRHAHVHEQISYVMQGALHFRLGADGEREQIVRAGEVLVLPSHLPHEAVALEESIVTDVFSPPREDWIARTDDYLRK
jgi:quercetin dioxygenase-like cupin family protein